MQILCWLNGSWRVGRCSSYLILAYTKTPRLTHTKASPTRGSTWARRGDLIPLGYAVYLLFIPICIKYLADGLLTIGIAQFRTKPYLNHTSKAKTSLTSTNYSVRLNTLSKPRYFSYLFNTNPELYRIKSTEIVDNSIWRTHNNSYIIFVGKSLF